MTSATNTLAGHTILLVARSELELDNIANAAEIVLRRGRPDESRGSEARPASKSVQCFQALTVRLARKVHRPPAAGVLP